MSALVWLFLTDMVSLIVPFITYRYAFDIIRYFLFENN